MLRSLAPLLAFVSLVAGCATVELAPSADKVIVLTAAPGATCRQLGTVFGQGGGYFTVGEFVSNDKLAASALNDARNKAAALGATHIVPSPIQITSEGTTATTTAAVYACSDASGAR